KLAQKGIAKTVNSLEMPEKEDQPLQVGRFQLAIDAVKGMGDGVGNFSALQITLERENIIPNKGDVVVLLLGNAPNEDVNFARIGRKICRNLFADEGIR